MPLPADAEAAQEPKTKKSRTNTPWTPAEELRLKQMRDTGNSWSEIAKVGRKPICHIILPKCDWYQNGSPMD
jgi:hypothetical protein